MKSLKTLVLLLVLGLPAYGQAVNVTANKLKGSATAPSGSCSAQSVQLTTAGVVYVCVSGTWTSSGGGTTINSTNGQLPYRVNSTTFGDSAFASNALDSTYLSATSGASGAGLTLTVAGGGSNENLILAADGQILLSNNAVTDFSRLQFGGTSASFPSIKRNGTALNFRLADDSADAPITAAAAVWSGHQTFATDNTYDIGASGATRPRNVFAAGYVSASTKVWAFEQHIGGSLAVPRVLIKGDFDNTMTLLDQTQTGFGRLQFGGTSASFPALKRSSAALETKLADDSAYAEHRALTFSVNNACVIRSGSGSPESAVTGNVCDLYLRTDGGASTTMYIKESGTGNTGWVAK